LKMSNSLKNFIKIKSLLKQYNGRQLRLLFLLHKYDVLQNFVEGSMKEAVDKDKRYTEFYLNMKANMREHPITEEQIWGEKDFELFKLFGEKKLAIHKHFCNNFNTPEVIHELDELISATNSYISKPPMRYPLMNSIGDYITFIFKVMGVQYEKKTAQTNEGNQSANIEEIATPYIDSLTKFRDRVREAAKNKEFVDILRACDELRDDTLPNLGVRLEDKPQGSLWKYESKEVLLKEKEEKQANLLKVQEEKLKKQEEQAKKAAELLEKSKIHQKDMFIGQTDLYSKFDEQGVPTHDKEGKELTKGLLKKLKKDSEAQEKLYQTWLEKNKST